MKSVLTAGSAFAKSHDLILVALHRYAYVVLPVGLPVKCAVISGRGGARPECAVQCVARWRIANAQESEDG